MAKATTELGGDSSLSDREIDPTGVLRVHTMRLEPLARYEVHL